MPIHHLSGTLDPEELRLSPMPLPHASAQACEPGSSSEAMAGTSAGGTVFALPGPRGELLAIPLPGPGADLEEYRCWGRTAGEFATATHRRSGSALTLDLSAEGSGGLEPAQLRQIIAGALAGVDEATVLGIRTTLAKDEFARVLAQETALLRGVELARALTDARANQLTPTGLAERAHELAAEAGLGCRITTADELRAGGFGGITAIGQGAASPPALVELWHSGAGAPGDAPPAGALAVAGKGVTFDSGGLSLKSPTAMYSMHSDCAGAAVVLGALTTLSVLGSRVPVHVALPLVENAPGPESIHPGDVVRTRNSTTVEIVDTDFEGRVILADAVAVLTESSPRAVLSLATLTYQIVVALGPEIAGLFARDEALAQRLLRAAENSGEALWRMPWATRYAAQLSSGAPGAQLRNHPLHDAGRAITAALFIGEFVPPEIPFAHIDFAGPAMTSSPDGPVATGYGVRTLAELFRSWEDAVS